MMEAGLDFGVLWQQLGTWKNLIIIVACGGAMEAFKRGPVTKKFAGTKWGQALQYYAPVGWCWAALFIPWGLSPENASVGEKLMLGVILGSMTSSVYAWAVQSAKKLIGSNMPSTPPALPAADAPGEPTNPG